MMKTCKKCGIEKNISDFYKDKSNKDGYAFYCKKCVSIYKRQWSDNNKKHKTEYNRKYYEDNKEYRSEYLKKYRTTEKYKSGKEKRFLYNREHALNANFKMTPQEYDEMLESQGNVCAICGGVNESGRMLAVDHCHETNQVRGLLCTNCNTGIGMLKDNIDLLQNAITYLNIGNKCNRAGQGR